MLYSTYTLGQDRKQSEQFNSMGLDAEDVQKSELYVEFDVEDVKKHMENTVDHMGESHTITVVEFYDMTRMMIVDDPIEFSKVRAESKEKAQDS